MLLDMVQCASLIAPYMNFKSSDRRWRCIPQPPLRLLDVFQRNTIQALAQHAFQRILPARFYTQAVPQPRQVFQPVLGQPRLQFLVLVEAALQVFQGVQPGFQLGGQALLSL